MPSARAIELPIVSQNVDFLTNIPVEVGGISAAFDPNRPFLYVSTVHGINVYDIATPEQPELVGSVPMIMFQNENVNVGAAASRRDGTTFVLVGTDLGGAATPTAPDATAVAPDYVPHVYVIDVTDPAAPFIRSHLATTTYTHTISCVDAGCHYAYTAGTFDAYSIVDLRDLDAPKEGRVVASKWGWHDWQLDGAGVFWETADMGTVAYDVSNPIRPRVLNSTNGQALTGAEWNDFIHHNSERPYARGFRAGTPPSVFRGNVLIVTEESTSSGPCADIASLQTWYVPTLRRGDNPSDKPGRGTIRPLDFWQAEIYDTGETELVGSECSAHYFDFHQQGFVAQAWYSHGVRILDVRDARDIKQVGYFVVPGQETWSAYWVPERDARGRVRRGPHGDVLRSEIVYSVDAGRGLDVLRVTLPSGPPARTRSVSVPVTRAWMPAAAPDSRFACRVATGR